MMELGNTSDKPYKKSARIVGEVLGKYIRTEILRIFSNGTYGTRMGYALSVSRWPG